MDIEEYKNKLAVIEHDYNKRKGALDRDYAFSNSSVIAGDIVTDHIGSILVESVKYTAGGSPACVYFGIELTKKMLPKKSGVKRKVWQGNLLESNN